MKISDKNKEREKGKTANNALERTNRLEREREVKGREVKERQGSGGVEEN